jgi:hypothetical protein
VTSPCVVSIRIILLFTLRHCHYKNMAQASRLGVAENLNLANRIARGCEKRAAVLYDIRGSYVVQVVTALTQNINDYLLTSPLFDLLLSRLMHHVVCTCLLISLRSVQSSERTTK